MGEVPYEAIPEILKGMVDRGIYSTLDEACKETGFVLRKKYREGYLKWIPAYLQEL